MKQRTRKHRTASADMGRADFHEYTVFCTHPDCHCGGSGCDSDELQQGERSRADAARRFKADGWTWTREHGWRCPPEGG